VPLGERAYDVIVGHGTRNRLPSLIPDGVRRIAIVTQDAIPFSIDDCVGSVAHERFVIDDGEHAKSLAAVEMLCRGFSRFGLTRRDLIVAVGGGMVTDVAGFAASCFHRGVGVLHVPTSLLGMVDAAIGGKTGVNLPEGKNLVGAFWQPIAVICDLDSLDSLPERELRCGYGEMAKYHFLTGEDLRSLALVDRIAMCAQIKADFVSADERESGQRALLNYGHTLAHALEVATDHRIAHGEAVAVGLVYAAELAHRLGRIDAHRVAVHRRVVVDEYGLSCTLPAGLEPAQLLALMGRDKKVVDGLTFVLDGSAGLEVVEGVDPQVVASVLDQLA
jgi:5-deoxy-5-amino-3-dehydroquinate synthase